jgi:hypothetical protein
MITLSYAPFGGDPVPPVYIPSLPNNMPTSDNTECNYIVMFFVAGVIVMGLMDSLRK